MAIDIPRLRLRNQQLDRPRFRSATDLVSHMGAVQAQEYWGGKLGTGLRLPNGTDAAVEQAIAAREIVRTWPMRGTLHFVAADDARWMLRLLTPRVIRGVAARRRQLELDNAEFAKARKLIVGALEGRNVVTRLELGRLLRENGIETRENRGGHIMFQLAQEETIVFGPHQGKQPAFALFDDWLPPAPVLEGDEAIVELTKRYFTSHGPATIADLCWWSGLTVREVKIGLEGAKDSLIEEDGYWMAPPTPVRSSRSRGVHLLPPFDEYTVAYRDRSAVIDAAHARLASNGGIFAPIVVIDGQVLGTWRRTLTEDNLSITATPFESFSTDVVDALTKAAERQARFLGVPLAGFSVDSATAAAR
jgi:hypothetical protein